jgi:transposase-like protein
MKNFFDPIPELDLSVFRGVMKALAEQGVDGFTPIFQLLLNEAMKVERSEHLQARPYERTEHRQGQANGFKEKTVLTRSGPLELSIPQVRDSSFYPRALEKGSRSEVALKLALAEMYVTGVSTRRVQKITEKLCGTSVSSTQVSRLSECLDEGLAKFRERSLAHSSYRYVYFDGTYQRIRFDGAVQNLAVLVAIGINSEGRKELLGVSVSLSEGEVYWREFFQSLVKRGLSGVGLFISDDHSGMRAAREAVFPSIPWQRCQFHLAQNAQGYAPNLGMKAEIGQAMRDIFNTPSIAHAQEMLKQVVAKYEKSAPRFVAWLEENVTEGFTVFLFPRAHWIRIRTSNVLERVNREIRRRTNVAVLFPNEESCLRLVSAVLQEIHEDWMSATIFLDMNQK